MCGRPYVTMFLSELLVRIAELQAIIWIETSANDRDPVHDRGLLLLFRTHYLPPSF